MSSSEVAAVIRDYWSAIRDDDHISTARFLSPTVECAVPSGIFSGIETVIASGELFRSSGRVVDLRIDMITSTAASVLLVEQCEGRGRAVQGQQWRRGARGWQLTAVHLGGPPVTFDRSVWRVVGDPLIPATARGPLDGEDVAVKDVFAVAGQRIGAGVPEAETDAEPESRHACVVERLIAAGASIRGIARTDQFAYSMAGDNPHSGTPPNAAVPGGLPGGSSSGPASAVALGAASIGLATDTAGSVRVPASYQGLWGIRTTQGAVPVDGMLPLAPTFDAVGLLTRDPELLLTATRTLMGAEGARTLGDATVDLGEVIDTGGGGLRAIAEAFRIHQAFQAWRQHGHWITVHPRALRGASADRFAAAAAITEDENARAREQLDHWAQLFNARLGDAVLTLPSTPSSAPMRWASVREIDRIRTATLQLTCIAAVTGRPAVSAPVGLEGTAPQGRGFVGPPGSDLALIRRAADLTRHR
jgi:amidase